MAAALALIDCNNFYASCEQVFDPAVAGRPLVVLSNNDGCIVARSREARELGIAMGTPYFRVAAQLQRQGVVVRSSNYALYGDMSQRVMACLERWVPELEVYSIDEAFVRLPALAPQELSFWAAELRVAVRQQLGLPIAVGLAPSKVLAKLANRLAKQDPCCVGVFNLLTEPCPEEHLAQLPVEEIWGVGRRLARWCRLRGLATARDLAQADPNLLRRGWGVVGLRLQQELRGLSCMPLELEPAAKQVTCVSRSFAAPVQELVPLRQAVASYVVRAAEKLRRQRQRAGCLMVFVRTSPFSSGFYANSASVVLPLASQDTAVLLQAALPLVERLYRPGRLFQKAGVVLQDLQPLEQLQQHLFVPCSPAQQQRRERLMQLVDGLNRRYGSGTLQWAAAGLEPGWRLRRHHLSRGYTTRLAELPCVQAR
jgi:DNA polymerase V